MPAKKRNVRGAESQGPDRLATETPAPKTFRPQTYKQAHGRTAPASRASNKMDLLGAPSSDAPPPGAPHTAIDWKDISKKLWAGLQKCDEVRYAEASDLIAVQQAMVATEEPLDTVPSVRKAFYLAVLGFKKLGADDVHLGILREKVPDAMLGAEIPSVNIFTYNMAHPCPDHFLAQEHALPAGLQVLFVNNAPMKTHVNRVSNALTTIELGVPEQIAKVNSSQVVVLHGESGSGKTLNAMLSACCHKTSKKGALCVCVVPEDVGVIAPGSYPSYDPSNSQPYKEEFKTRFARTLTMTWNYLASQNTALTGRATEGHVTVLFDEFGSYPDAVRAICGLQLALVQRTRTQLRLGAAVTVQIIVAGTGAHGGTHMPGSQPGTYHLQTVTPAVWKTSQQKEGKPGATPLGIDVCKAVNGRQSRAAYAAWRMVTTNARACGIFLREVASIEAQDKRVVSPKLLSDLVSRTAERFKSLNGLEMLHEDSYLHVYYRAVALSLYAAEENPGAEGSKAVAGCFEQYGMVTDRAVKVAAPHVPAGMTFLQNLEDGKMLCLPNEFNGQRFYLSEAQIVIAQTVLGVGCRGHTGEGFEDLVADLFMHAALLAPLLKGKKLLSPVERSGPNGWMHTLDLLPMLIESARTTSQKGERTVIRARLQEKIQPGKEPKKGGGQNPSRDEKAIDWASQKDVDAVLLNADTAAFADLIFKQEGIAAAPTVWLVQIKRYESTVLTAAETHSELAKMSARLVEPTLQTIAGAMFDAKRVIFLWGKPPAAVFNPPSDALLVHAWDPNDKVLAKSPALGGLYPFSHRDADFSILPKQFPGPSL